ncbi:FMN reductase [Arthrobacter russicus]|jgi:FMN reductase|uniref:FMN reductase n=1 Tax=Arthrobacter russicus TaxID=172040 RepID=A0ABU1J9T5_9MICC|nr:FMN reductase [Arthrobacter russicus]MDR6269180.1 FMN reductase [Arthrobacter russicus]
MERVIMVISAGLGVPSSSRMLADQLAAATAKQIPGGADPVRFETVELRDFAVDIANNFVTGYAAPGLQKLIDRVQRAAGLIVVTPVFSGSFSGLFKSFFDLIDPKSLDGIPVLLAASGGSARHSLVIDFAMRPLFSYLRTRIMPTGVYASPEDWGVEDPTQTPLSSRISQAAGELAAALDGNSVRRDAAARLESLPFEQLLANITPRG